MSGRLSTGCLLALVLHSATGAPADAPAAPARGVASVAAAEITAAEDTALTERLAKARELMNARRPEQAIREQLDPVIARYEAAYRGLGKAVYCAREPAEALMYSVRVAAAASSDPSLAKTETIVLGPNWAEAYLLKGFSLVELKDLEAAKAALQAAVALSPQNPQYLAELAYVTQMQGGSEEALALYRESADAAMLIADENRQRSHAGRACRGQGYALVELKRLDEAVAQYHQCLALDPGDRRSEGELQYIEGLRRTH